MAPHVSSTSDNDEVGLVKSRSEYTRPRHLQPGLAPLSRLRGWGMVRFERSSPVLRPHPRVFRVHRYRGIQVAGRSAGQRGKWGTLGNQFSDTRWDLLIELISTHDPGAHHPFFLSTPLSVYRISSERDEELLSQVTATDLLWILVAKEATSPRVRNISENA